MDRNAGSRCLSLFGYPHLWATAMKMTNCEDNPPSSCHTVPLWRAVHVFHRGKKRGVWSMCSSNQHKNNYWHCGQVPSGAARGVVGTHWNEEATAFNVVASWTRSKSCIFIYWRHLLQSVSDSAKTAHGCREASVCSTQLGNCYEDKWYTSHQISTLAASSGLAERFVQTMKWALCSSEGRASVHECLTNFSLSYRNSFYHWKSISSTANVQPTVGYLLDLLRSRMTQAI